MKFLQIFLRKSIVLAAKGLLAFFGVFGVSEWFGGKKICLGSHRYLGSIIFMNRKKSSLSLMKYMCSEGITQAEDDRNKRV